MLTPNFTAIPAALTERPQWVAWMLAENPGKAKGDKIPLHPGKGYAASNRKPEHWGTFAQAQAFYTRTAGKEWTIQVQGKERKGPVCGVGFVLTESDPFTGIDLDGCLNPDGSLEPWAKNIVDTLNTYTEVSPSGTGVRAFVVGKLPSGERRKGPIELYDTGRYLTLTGHVIGGCCTIQPRQAELEQVHKLLQPEGKPQQATQQTYTPRQCTLELGDLLNRARKAKNGGIFCTLFDVGDISAFPSHSEADQSLCNILAFWLNRDATAMDAAFRQSALFNNEGRAQKWDSVRVGGQTYGQATISKAISQTGQTFQQHTPQQQQGKKAGGSTDANGVSPQLQAAQNVIASVGKENLLYAQTSFWKWQGHVWSKADDLEIKQNIQRSEAQNNTKLTANYVSGVCSLVQNEAFKPDHTFDADSRAVAVKNGELHLVNDAWELQPHRRESFRTTCLPITYDATATAPRFVQFLEEIFRDDPDKAQKQVLVCEAIGYTLLSCCDYEKFFMLIGAGANGKSVLLNVLYALLGHRHVCAVQPSQFQNRFQRAHMHGKLANIVTELAEGAEIADAELKAIVSGELTTAEHKLKPPFDFHPFCTCWFGTNHLPHTRDFSQALFRRAIVLQFNRVFAEHEQDKRLKDTLLSELPGILNLALAAIAQVFRRGMFTVPASSEVAKGEWRLEADQVAQFTEEQCVFEAGASIGVSDLYTAYQAWAEAAGIRRHLNKNNFSNRIARLGAERDKGTAGKRNFYGVRLRFQ